MNASPKDKLSDVLQHHLKVVFCGTAAGKTSENQHEYYAKSSNGFWGALYRTGLTPSKLRPAEFRRLLDYGIGLTDIAKKHSGVDASIPALAYEPALLREKILFYQPRVLAFNGKKAARIFYGLGDRQSIIYGPQEIEAGLGSTLVYVLPSTSGNAGKSWDIECWQKLADFIPHVR